MNCPECNAPNSRILQTRIRPDEAVRRRRVCEACTHRWSTLERSYKKLPHPKKGETVPRLRPGPRKLNTEQALAIYHANMDQTTLAKLAEQYGVSREAIRQLRAGMTYKTVLEQAATLQLCTSCIHWATTGHFCTMGFPDPALEGPTFAKDCSLYNARQSFNLA